jgi:hypothetical protein
MNPATLNRGALPSGASSLLQHLGWTVPAGERARFPLEGWWTSDVALVAAATTLRRFHDAQADYEAPPTATWSEWFADWPARKRPVICHNEFGPAHAVRRPDDTLAMADFGVVAPGPRLLDVAYSAWTWVPITGDVECDRPRRLRLFADVYGLSPTQRTRLIRAMRRRVVAHIEILKRDEERPTVRPLVRSLRTLDFERHLLEQALQ